MLSVSDRAIWEAYFSSRSDLKNCNVEFWNNNGVSLFDKTSIESYNIVSRNSFVCDQIPTDECELKVFYDTLSTYGKSYLTTNLGSNRLLVKYRVNGDVTTGTKVLVVKSFKISRDQKHATFNLASPLSNLSTRAVNFEFGNATVNSIPDTLTGWGSRGAKYNISRAELFPVRCLKEKKGIVYVDTNSQDTEFSLKTFSPTVNDGAFDGLNIIDDYDIDSDEPDKSEIDLYGAIAGETLDDVVIDFTFQPSEEVAVYSGFTDNLYLRGYSVKNIAGTEDYSNAFRIIIQNDRLVLTTSSSFTAGTQMRWTIKLATLSIKNPTDNSKAYIQSEGVPTLGNSDDSTLRYVRTYYGNNSIISFNCRIDPTLEPLDLISLPINGTNYRVALEEVSISFNGGFKGSIKARILDMISSIEFDPLPYYNFIVGIGNVWEFGGKVMGTFYDGTTRDVTNDVIFTGAPTYPPANHQQYYIQATYNQKGISKSLPYIAVYWKLYPPIVNNVYATENELAFDVTRNSLDEIQCPAVLCIKNSQGYVRELMSFEGISIFSIQSFNINEYDYPLIWSFIKQDVSNWVSSSLVHDVTCFFRVDSGNTTGEIVILEANNP